MENNQSTITLRIRDYLSTGLAVYDSDSEKIGTIIAADPDAGYMTVRSYPLPNALLYVPVSAITRIDRREVFLSQVREELQKAYSDPPPRETLVRPRTDPDTGADESEAITREPSGYDGKPVVVEVANIGELAHHIAPGFRVYTSVREDIGTVKTYDREAAKLIVAQRFPTRREFVVPLAVVDAVDREKRTVQLAVSAADLERPVAVHTIDEPANNEITVDVEIVEPEITDV